LEMPQLDDDKNVTVWNSEKKFWSSSEREREREGGKEREREREAGDDDFFIVFKVSQARRRRYISLLIGLCAQ
jgi:hypothetical protein